MRIEKHIKNYRLPHNMNFIDETKIPDQYIAKSLDSKYIMQFNLGTLQGALFFFPNKLENEITLGGDRIFISENKISLGLVADTEGSGSIAREKVKENQELNKLFTKLYNLTQQESLEESIKKLNNELATKTGSKINTTATIIYLDNTKKTAKLINCGGDTQSFIEDLTTGTIITTMDNLTGRYKPSMRLGYFSGNLFNEQLNIAKLKYHNQRILICSDGLIEKISEHEKEAAEKIKTIIMQNNKETETKIISKIIDYVQQLDHTPYKKDDITILMIRTPLYK